MELGGGAKEKPDHSKNYYSYIDYYSPHVWRCVCVCVCVSLGFKTNKQTSYSVDVLLFLLLTLCRQSNLQFATCLVSAVLLPIAHCSFCKQAVRIKECRPTDGDACLHSFEASFCPFWKFRDCNVWALGGEETRSLDISPVWGCPKS